jgi:hypothetical protein
MTRWYAARRQETNQSAHIHGDQRTTLTDARKDWDAPRLVPMTLRRCLEHRDLQIQLLKIMENMSKHGDVWGFTADDPVAALSESLQHWGGREPLIVQHALRAVVAVKTTAEEAGEADRAWLLPELLKLLPPLTRAARDAPFRPPNHQTAKPRDEIHRVLNEIEMLSRLMKALELTTSAHVDNLRAFVQLGGVPLLLNHPATLTLAKFEGKTEEEIKVRKSCDDRWCALQVQESVWDTLGRVVSLQAEGSMARRTEMLEGFLDAYDGGQHDRDRLQSLLLEAVEPHPSFPITSQPLALRIVRLPWDSCTHYKVVCALVKQQPGLANALASDDDLARLAQALLSSRGDPKVVAGWAQMATLQLQTRQRQHASTGLPLPTAHVFAPLFELLQQDRPVSVLACTLEPLLRFLSLLLRTNTECFHAPLDQAHVLPAYHSLMAVHEQLPGDCAIKALATHCLRQLLLTQSQGSALMAFLGTMADESTVKAAYAPMLEAVESKEEHGRVGGQLRAEAMWVLALLCEANGHVKTAMTQGGVARLALTRLQGQDQVEASCRLITCLLPAPADHEGLDGIVMLRERDADPSVVMPASEAPMAAGGPVPRLPEGLCVLECTELLMGLLQPSASPSLINAVLPTLVAWLHRCRPCLPPTTATALSTLAKRLLHTESLPTEGRPLAARLLAYLLASSASSAPTPRVLSVQLPSETAAQGTCTMPLRPVLWPIHQLA